MVGPICWKGEAAMSAKQAWHIFVMFVGSAILVFVLGFWGWTQQAPGSSWTEWIYRALQLFTLDAAADEPLTWQLEIARFIAAIIFFFGAWQVLRFAVRNQTDRYKAKRFKDHVVILGDGPEVVPLASGFSSRAKVVVVGAGSKTTEELKAKQIVVFEELDDATLKQIARHASKVVIAGRSDSQTIGLLGRLDRTDEQWLPLALFDSSDLARQWQRDAVGILRPISRSTQMAVELLIRQPPYPLDVAVPDPVVIGDGQLAAELVRRIAVAYQFDGRRPKVRCLGVSDNWLRDLDGEVPESAMEFIRVPSLSSTQCIAQIDPLLKPWRAAQDHSAGARVYVATSDDAQSSSIVTALLHRFTDCPVGVAIDDDVWSKTLQNPGCTYVSRDALLSNPDALERGEAQLLRSALENDLPSWPPGTPGLDVQQVIERLVADDAKLACEVLSVGGLELEKGGEPADPPMLDPGMLAQMASVLIAELAVSPNQQAWALELSARLPGLMQCSGWAVRCESLLDSAAVERMAKLVHSRYQEEQRQLGNPTSSPQARLDWDQLSEVHQASNRSVVFDYPVRLARLNLAWRRAEAPARYQFAPHQLEELAEAEHRRWWRFQRVHGTGEHHRFATSWSELPGEVKRLDQASVTSMILALEAEKIEIFQP